MKIIIAGSRSIRDYELLKQHMKHAVALFAALSPQFKITEIVSGGAPGVDVMGEWWARANRVPVIKFVPEWKRKDGSINKAAGFVRNAKMAQYADGLVALWDGSSRGTADMIKRMEDKAGTNLEDALIYVYNADIGRG